MAPAQPPNERSLWLSSGGQVESTIPMDLVNARGLRGGEPISIRPVIEETTLAWRIVDDETVTGDRVNDRKVKHRAEPNDQYTLRFPGVLAAMSGLDRLVVGENASLEYERAERGFRVRTWPPLRPWMPPATDDDLDVDPVEKRLVELPNQFHVEIATPHARELDLEKGQPVAFRFTVRDGQIAVVADLNVASEERDRAHIRQVQSHVSGGDGREMEQFRIYVPKAAVHALNWDDTPLTFEVEPGRIVITRASIGNIENSKI